MTEPGTPPLGKKEAKAQAAAAKAYQKSQRNVLARHKILTGLAALIVVIVASSVASSSGGGNAITGQKSTVTGSDTSTSAPDTSATTSDTSATTPQNAAVGQGLHVTGNEGVDATVVLSSFITATKGPGEGAEAPKNGHYVVGKFLITDTAGTYNFNLLYLKFQTADGTTYTGLDGNSAYAGFQPSLSAGSLSAGQKTGGVVAFDVPEVHGIIQLTDPLGGVVGQWTV
jgi:hypothetical protein